MAQSLQSPFLSQDLLPLSSFVSYCRDNGIETDKEELEYFAQEGLLVPAVRVVIGIVTYRRIFAEFDGKDEWRHIHADDLRKFNFKKLDPKEYYDRGSLSYGDKNWMKWYMERDMVRFPAQEGYKPWSSFEVNRDDYSSVFGTNSQDYENASEFMYSKYQSLPLSDIKNYRTLIIKDKALFRTPEQWSKEGTYITEMFTKGTSNEFIKAHVKDWYHLLGLLADIHSMLIERNTKIRELYRESFNTNGGNRKEALRDGQSATERLDVEARERAAKLLSKHGFTVDEIKDWRYKIMSKGSFGIGLHAKALQTYITRLDDSLLESTEDAYMIVNQLSWFLGALGEERLSARQLILGSMNEACAICGRSFKSTRRTQKTCASKECQQKWQNQSKRRKRSSGEYPAR